MFGGDEYVSGEVVVYACGMSVRMCTLELFPCVHTAGWCGRCLGSRCFAPRRVVLRKSARPSLMVPPPTCCHSALRRTPTGAHHAARSPTRARTRSTHRVHAGVGRPWRGSAKLQRAGHAARAVRRRGAHAALRRRRRRRGAGPACHLRHGRGGACGQRAPAAAADPWASRCAPAARVCVLSRHPTMALWRRWPCAPQPPAPLRVGLSQVTQCISLAVLPSRVTVQCRHDAPCPSALLLPVAAVAPLAPWAHFAQVPAATPPWPWTAPTPGSRRWPSRVAASPGPCCSTAPSC